MLKMEEDIGASTYEADEEIGSILWPSVIPGAISITLVLSILFGFEQIVQYFLCGLLNRFIYTII